MSLFRKISLPLILCLLLCSSMGYAKNLSFSIHPFTNPTIIYQTFQPLIDYLSEKSGTTIKIKIAPNYLAHVNTLSQGEAELGFVGPSPYVRAKDRSNTIELLARFKMLNEVNDRVVIICQSSAPYQSLSDLSGASFVFGDRQSFGSHFMPRWLLANQGIPLSSLKAYNFVRSHDNVILSVLHGDFAAGGVRLDVFNRYKERPLRVLAGPFIMPPHAIVCLSTLATSLKEKLRMSLLSLNDPKILHTINPLMEKFAPVSDIDFSLARKVMHFIEK